MQGTYDAIAGDRVLLLAVLVAALAVAIVGSYLAGVVADALMRYVHYLDHRATDKRGNRHNFVADYKRANKVARVAYAIDRTAIRWPLIALYWRVRVLLLRRRVRQRIDRLR